MTHTVRLAGLVVVLTAPLHALPEFPEYLIVELAPLTEGNPSTATAINELGQVVGSSVKRELFTRDIHPVLWKAGEIIDLGLLPGGRGGDGAAADINNRGQVVGFSAALGCQDECSRAFLWEDGTMIDLGAIGESSGASAINDAGLIVGTSSTGAVLGSSRTAVLWDHGAIIDLGMLPGDSSSEALAINNRGQIVGSSRGGLSSRAVMWEKGQIFELPGLSFAIDINDRSQILGSAGGRAVLWVNGTMTPLDLPPGSQGTFVAAALNNRGQVVGTVTAPGQSFGIPVLWQQGDFVQLPTLPNEQAMARGINNRGEIVGSMFGSTGARAVLWVRHDEAPPTLPPARR